MLFWLSVAVLVAVVLLALLRPLLRRSLQPADVVGGADMAVYRDQLDEIERDAARGLISASDAEAARAEVGRRLLAHAGPPPVAPSAAPEQASTPTHGARQARLAFVGGIAVVPFAALAVYGLIGSPHLPDRPHQARAEAQISLSPVDELVARVEARLREHPEDGAGWDVIAPVYLRMERFAEAREAYARAIRLLGDSPQRLEGFAEAAIISANGVVTEPARQAFAKVLSAQPDNPRAAFWLAVALEQDGKLAEAAERYRKLLAAAPADAPWRGAVSERMMQVLKSLGAPGTGASDGAATANAPPAGGGGAGLVASPDEAQVSAAAQLSPEERAKFIESMVEGLAARLKEDGRDADGWMRLVRAYTVLGRSQRASQALGEARAALTGDTEALGRLDELAKSLGLGS